MFHSTFRLCLVALFGAVFAFADTGEGRLFPKSDKITLKKVSFKNQYDMKVVGNLFVPKNLDKGKKHAVIIVGHPMGAVKEQSASLYAYKMAEAGFVALAIDLSFWGESAGTPRNSVLPDIYAEDFSAAADFLGTQSFIDPEKIGVIGVCGSGSFAVSAAKIDPRLKAIATISMYDMGAADIQVKAHIQGNLNIGNDRARLIATLTALVPYIGYPRVLNALGAIPKA